MNPKKADEIRSRVRESYSKVAEGSAQGGGCCSPVNAPESACCGPADASGITSVYSTRLGYSEEEVAAVPAGADLGLGCGNPRAIAALKPGEVVLDLGSGAGFDCFLAAREVGARGRVIGVDMTPAMLSKARANASQAGVENVEFRLGEIENLPVADATVDVIISNCVINLSPDKGQVFREAMRVLKPGGRLAISDIVTRSELPPEIQADLALHSACIAGATPVDELKRHLRETGFEKIAVVPKDGSKEFIRDWAPGRKVEDYIVSASIEAVKPSGVGRSGSSTCCG